MTAYSMLDIDTFVADTTDTTASWMQIAPANERPVTSPAFMLGSWPSELTYGFYNETKVGPVRCYRLRNIRLTFDGIMLAGEDALVTTLVNHPIYHVDNVLRRLSSGTSALSVRHVEGQAVMLSGPGCHIYGHWLVDILPRLFVLANCGYDIGVLRYVVPTILPEFCHEYLRLIGISRNQLLPYDEGAEMLEVEELLVPTNLRSGSQIHPLMRQAIRFMRERFFSQREPSFNGGRRRLFISRRSSESSRTLTNRPQIEDLAVDAGFELVQPEIMSIPEQISLFSSSLEIVGEYGSGLHGSVFAPPGTAIMALRGSSHHPGFIQSGLGQVFRQPTGYVLSPTPIDAVDQSFEVSSDAFRLGLKCLAVHSAHAKGCAL